MDLFGKKRIDYLERRIVDLEINAYLTEMRCDEIKEESYRREKAFKQKGLEQRQQLEHLQKKLRRIRETARLVRAGEVTIKKLLKEILNGKVC